MEEVRVKPIAEVFKEIEASIKGNESNVVQNDRYVTPVYGQEENVFRDIKKDVPVDAIYSRLSDGSYSAKYDNYIGAVGNEDRLAREQGAFEQAITGLTKNVAKVGLYAADATIGTAYGIANAIDRGDWKGFWDNDFSRGIDDLNTKLDNNLANYYTDEQKNMGVLRSMLTTNFWFNDVAGGLAFVGGAILPEVAIGILTGGTSLGVSAAKLTAKQGVKSFLKEGSESAFKKGLRDITSKIPVVKQYTAGKKVLRDINASIYTSSKVGDFIGTTAFLARSSGFEAGMEARHNYKEAIENYVANYEAMNGELPGYEELTAFVKDAESAANGVFATNLALLSVSNSVMFADKFKIAQGFRKDLSRKFDSYIGLGVKVEGGAGGKIVAQQATKGQKALGKTYKILAKPAVEGLYEEGLQGVAGKTMQNYLTAKYDPNSDQTVDVMAATMDALKEQYSSKEGWKEMVIGMIIGSGAGLLQGGSVAGFGKDSWTARSKEIAKQTKVANASLENLTGNINRATVMSNLANQIESGQSVSQVVDIESSLMHKEYIKTQETFKSQEQILEDYETIVEKMELSDQELKQIGGVENLDTYKNQLRETFKRDLSNYNEAVKLTEALGIENIEIPGKGKLNKGNTLGLKDFVQTNLMLGYAAEQGAMQIAETIGAVTGESGIYSAMNVVSGLKEQQVKTLDKIKEKQQRLSELREVSERYLRQMESSSTQETAEKYQRHAELYTKAIAEEQQLQEEVTRLSSSLSTVETMQEGGQFELEGLENVLVDQGILSAMEKLDKMDAYIKALKKEGREKEAKDLEYLIQEYKNQADAARETKKFYADMASGRFLQGKKSLPSIILGDNYKLEEGTKKIIEENELEIDRALGAVGYRGPEKALEKFNELVANNPNLSDREKFKIDRYVRMFLTQSEYANQAHRREESESEVETTRSNGLTKGDTITIKDNPKYSAEELGDIETLNKIIADMEQAIKDYRKSGKELRNPIESRNQTESNTELQQLEAQLAELKEKANSLGDNSQVQDLSGNTYSVNESDITTYETESGPIRYITNEDGDMVMLSDKNTDAVQEEIQQLEKQIQELRNQPTPETKEVDTGINRLSELEAKEVKQELTEEEAEELNELRNEIDDWILASGTVYQGFRLSDLIRQREVLLNTPIEKVEKVDIVSDADLKASVEIPDRQSKGNYALAQHYDGVTATRVKDGDGKGTPMIEIHNTRPERFTEEVGFEFPYTTNTKGNILVTEEIAERINSDSNVRIETTKDATGSNYTTVKVRRVNLKGETVWEDLKSDYNEETTKPQNTDALYAMKEGEAIQFEIDPKDSYNQKLIEEYKKTGNKTKLKNSLLIRVLDSKGNFVSVLKGKEKNNKVFKDSKRFEAFRDNIIENEDYFEMITESTLPIIIEGHNAKVDKVLIGHPNTRQEYVALTKDDSAVQDIGFVEKGKVWTKSQKGDVDTTFLSRTIKNSKSDAKIPFLVFNRGGRRIAYPVKFIQGDNTAVEELTRVYNSNTAQVDKVVALNKILASRGIDIKEGGNAFVTTRDFTNLTDEFFNSKVVQLENRPYIQNLENWKGSSMSLDAIIGQGILHNLNLDSPISSPKLQMDLSKLNVKPTAFSQVKNETGQKDSTKDAIDSNKNQAEKDLNEDC